MTVRKLRAVGLAIAVLGAWAVIPAVAEAQDFTCRGSAVRVDIKNVGMLEPFVANIEPECTDASAGVLMPTTVQTVTAGVLNTRTNDDNGAHAEAEAVGVSITLPNGEVLSTRLLWSSADAQCVNGTPTFSHAGRTAELFIGGEQRLPGSGAQQTLVLPGVTIVTNERFVTGGDTITRRALHIFTTEPLFAGLVQTDIVISESIADVHNCGRKPPPECSDGVDNADPEDQLADQQDPGCHTDGDPNNPNSYDPNDPDETDQPKAPECSDGRDNADPEDQLADQQDPGCHTDGDPNNPDSYDPNDPDETDQPKAPECSDGIDNDKDGVADRDDPGCHTDGDPKNPDSYDPNDPNEYPDRPFECSDGIDNDGNKDVDENDPDCHSDGNPNNPDSYVPSNSEGPKDGGGNP